MSIPQPMRMSQWKYAGDGGRSEYGAARGMQLKQMQAALAAQYVTPETLARSNHVVTTGCLAKLDKFPTRPVQCDTWEGVQRSERGRGTMPVIRAMFEDGRLPEGTSKENVVREVVQHQRMVSARTHDTMTAK